MPADPGEHHVRAPTSTLPPRARRPLRSRSRGCRSGDTALVSRPGFHEGRVSWILLSIPGWWSSVLPCVESRDKRSKLALDRGKIPEALVQSFGVEPGDVFDDRQLELRT